MKSEPVFGFYRCVAFYDYVRVDGWVVTDRDDVDEIDLSFKGETVHRETRNLHLPSPDVKLHPNCRFSISCFLTDASSHSDGVLTFRMQDGSEWNVLLEEYMDELLRTAGEAFDNFTELVNKQSGARIIEVGARARSDVALRHLFPRARYTGVDILDGPNVDIVADAHELSAVVGVDTYDFALSISTFEHLAMPWKAVIELNRVLKPGGTAYVQSHQMCGMHELPWDFWRFSSAAFHSLFNVHTGFEVIETGQHELMHPVPLFRSRKWGDAVENSGGWFHSHVTARKIGPTTLRWDVPLSELVETPYPA